MMNIVCVICSDCLTPSDDIFYTPCGHTFHFACVTQWLERSRTCPQCREKVTQSKIHRLYFNFSNNDTIVEDATSLQAANDSLKFQLLVKEREVKQFLTKYETSKTEAAGLRAEIRKLESELTQKGTAILSLKEQTKFFRDQGIEAEKAKTEVARLKKKLDEYRSVQILLNAPSEDVDEMIINTTDPSKLLTYISVLKRELTTSVARRKELRTSVKKLQQELTTVSMERNFYLEEHEKRKQLEDQLAVSQSEKYALETRLREFEDGTSSHRSKNVQRRKTDKALTSDKTLDEHAESSIEEAACALEKPSDVIDLCEDSPCQRKPTKQHLRGNEENSPFSGLRYNISAKFGDRKTKHIRGGSAYSSLAKKPRLAQTIAESGSSSTMTFDGFGGHSKNDKFPSPKKHNEVKKQSRSVPRKSKLDDGNNRKLGAFMTVDP